LTKTHVEAITSFSIFLSGFLVKLAIYGLVKFQIFTNPLLVAALLPLTLLSIAVASVGFAYQTDYKKVIAYATVQEMNVLTLVYLLTVQSDPQVVTNLLIVHTLLSGLFFTVADLLYKKFGSRSLKSLKGLLQLAPKMSTALVVAVLVFKGLPYTAKFPIEFAAYSVLLQENKLLGTFVILCVVFVGNLFFTVLNMAVLFGSARTNTAHDLTIREWALLATPIVWLAGFVL
jgi:NADH:ubiquinone oxidoreductase subunit 4 (subunit M)